MTFCLENKMPASYLLYTQNHQLNHYRIDLFYQNADATEVFALDYKNQ